MTITKDPPGDALNDRNTPTLKQDMPPGLTEEDAGLGVSFNRDDILTPRLSIFQSNSPEVNVRDVAHLVGAEAGHWHARSALTPIISGVVGINAIWCGQRHGFIQWRPARGGFVAWHDEEPADTVDGLDDKGRPIRIRSSNKNVVEETRELYLLVQLDGVWQPYLFSCRSTFHQFAKDLNSHFHQYRFASGKVMPSYARMYRLTTFSKKNPWGTWFMPKYEDLDWMPEDVVPMARAFATRVKQGNTRGDYQGESPDA